MKEERLAEDYEEEEEKSNIKKSEGCGFALLAGVLIFLLVGGIVFFYGIGAFDKKSDNSETAGVDNVVESIVYRNIESGDFTISDNNGDFTTKDWKKITLRKRKEGNLYDSMQIAFRDEDELQEYIKDHNGTIFTCSDPTLFVLWCYKRQFEFLTLDEWNKVDAEAVERRLSYSPEQVKIVKDTQKHISTFYRIKPE